MKAGRPTASKMGRAGALATALYVELRIRPTVTTMTLGSIFVGVCALVLGEGASRAFTIIGGEGGAAAIARVMGALLAVGGVLTVAGIVRQRSLWELFGLGLVAAGAFIYGAAVLLGLGRNGLIAGGWALSFAVGMALRVVLLAGAAHTLYRDR